MTLYRIDLTRDDLRDIAGSAGVSLPTLFWILDGLREGLVPVESEALELGIGGDDPNVAVCNCGTVTTGERWCDDCMIGGGDAG